MTTDGVNCLNDLRKSNSGFHPLLKGLKHLRIKGSANRYKFQLQTPKIVADNSRPPLDNVKVNQAVKDAMNNQPDSINSSVDS